MRFFIILMMAFCICFSSFSQDSELNTIDADDFLNSLMTGISDEQKAESDEPEDSSADVKYATPEVQPSSEISGETEIPFEKTPETAGLTESDPDFEYEPDSSSEIKDFMNTEVIIPAKKTPKRPDPEKVSAAQQRDENGEEFEKNKNAIKFGTASEISAVIEKINKDDDPRYNDTLYELFYRTSSNDIKGRLLEYFAKQEDSCLENYAVEILDDPYDTPVSVVEQCFSYVSAVKCREAGPAIVKILETGEDKYFNAALSALGKTGGAAEAKYLAEYLKRDDLTVPQRQTLMRTLGAMNASEIWEEICLIAQDEDENSFVRMYAAEALGRMKKEESVPVLIKLFEEGSPNMRQYCIKGLANFSDSDKAKEVIIQGIRDDHYKVRIESIRAVKELNITEAVGYLKYRAQNDVEKVVKQECFPVLAELKTKEADDFLIGLITDRKTGDGIKYQAAEALMKAGTAGEAEIIELGKEAVKDDKRKSLRQNLGKLFIKYARPGYAELCVLYLQSKDTLTQSQGLELYRNARYESAKPSVLAITENKNAGTSNRERAKKLLGITDDEPK